MNIKRLGDLIVDRLGNYYHVVDKQGDTLILANAFMELSFRRKLDDLYIEEHYGEYVGEHAMSLLKSNIERIKAKKNMLKIIPLEDVEQEYDVQVKPLYERHRET
jgi:hypothetical protein